MVHQFWDHFSGCIWWEGTVTMVVVACPSSLTTIEALAVAIFIAKWSVSESWYGTHQDILKTRKQNTAYFQMHESGTAARAIRAFLMTLSQMKGGIHDRSSWHIPNIVLWDWVLGRTWGEMWQGYHEKRPPVLVSSPITHLIFKRLKIKWVIGFVDM